jgi:hypothetical protein
MYHKNLKDNFIQTLFVPAVTFKELYYENMATLMGEQNGKYYEANTHLWMLAKCLIAFNEICNELVTSVHEIDFLRVHEGINITTMEPKIIKLVILLL